MRWNPHTTQARNHNTKTTKVMKVPNSRRLKIMATQVSAKLTGYEHVGAAFSPHLVIHKYTHNIDVRRGEVLIPCTQTIMCGQCVLSGSMLWRGFAWKFSPPSQGIDCAQSHILKPCMQITLPFYVYVPPQSNVMLGCKDLDSHFTTKVLRFQNTNHGHTHAPFT